MKKGTFVFSVVFIALAFTSFSFKPATKSKEKVVWSQVVHLNAEQSGSASGSKGLVILKLTDDMQLTYKIIMQKVDEGDMLTCAKIRIGEEGEVGSFLEDLSAGLMNLGKFQTVKIWPKSYYYILNQDGSESLFVVVHSLMHPDGSVRGQIEY